MPESYGRRLVQEPERRSQEYIVGDRTVRRDELQSILKMYEYILVGVAPEGPLTEIMLKEVNRIDRAVQNANNISDWDWLEGIGESYLTEYEVPSEFKGDKLLYPKRWWPELPPCPLRIV